MERTLIAPGVHLSCDPAEKFNRCRISVHFAFPAKRETATAHALLPLVLDGGIQRLTRYESGNIRRLLTGMLFGYALVGLLVLSTIGAARWGYQLGKQLAV